MAFSSHKGTQGHAIGKSIMGRDTSVGTSNSNDPDAQSEGNVALGFQHMSVRPSNNGGFSVTHQPKTPVAAGEKAGAGVAKAETPVEEQLHVFRSAEEAHNHIGQLLGVRMGSGAQSV